MGTISRTRKRTSSDGVVQDRDGLLAQRKVLRLARRPRAEREDAAHDGRNSRSLAPGATSGESCAIERISLSAAFPRATHSLAKACASTVFIRVPGSPDWMPELDEEALGSPLDGVVERRGQSLATQSLGASHRMAEHSREPTHLRAAPHHPTALPLAAPAGFEPAT